MSLKQQHQQRLRVKSHSSFYLLCMLMIKIHSVLTVFMSINVVSINMHNLYSCPSSQHHSVTVHYILYTCTCLHASYFSMYTYGIALDTPNVDDNGAIISIFYTYFKFEIDT